MNSKLANKIEKIKTKHKWLNFRKKDNKNTGIDINKARKEGIKIIEIGIKNLKSESKVKEIEIQYKLDKK